MTVEDLTLEVLAERLLSPFDSKRLVSWAIHVLQLGYESENLYVLAGLDFDSTEEREKYFSKALEDLKFNTSRTDEELIHSYAVTIANKAMKEEITLDYAFAQMLKLVSASDYDQRYTAFYEIDEDLDYLNYYNSTIYNTGLSLSNYQSFILNEFKIFLEMEQYKIPLSERDKCYCQKCKKFITPVTKKKFRFTKPYKYAVWSCSACGSEELLFSQNHKVKRMLIDKYKAMKANV